MDKKRIALSSWSGGKDSCLAYYRALKQGVKVASLLNFIGKDSKRACFHGIEGRLMKFQADLIGVPLYQKEVSPDMKQYESEFKEAVQELKKTAGINSMVFGDIYLLEHQNWVERVCGDLAITAIEPLWKNDPKKIIEEFLESGFKAVIVSCKADCLGPEFIGRSIDKKIIKEFEAHNVCPCGEKGEYHTLVVDGPIFKKRIKIVESETIQKKGFWTHWFMDIKNYTTVDKG
jgi:uncharacterized protein (TIGR00290 family)